MGWRMASIIWLNCIGSEVDVLRLSPSTIGRLRSIRNCLGRNIHESLWFSTIKRSATVAPPKPDSYLRRPWLCARSCSAQKILR